MLSLPMINTPKESLISYSVKWPTISRLSFKLTNSTKWKVSISYIQRMKIPLGKNFKKTSKSTKTLRKLTNSKNSKVSSRKLKISAIKT